MTRAARTRTHRQEKEEREDKEIERRHEYVTIGLVVRGQMENIYGKLTQVNVTGMAGSSSYVIRWRSAKQDGAECEGRMHTRMRRCWVYNPYSLEWEDHIKTGITYICVDD